MNIYDRIVQYESDELTNDEIIDMFAYIIKNKINLQGHYGRVSRAMIEEGFISPDGDVLMYLEN